MKITLLTIGSRGDVQPMVALGLGLQQAGHTVTLAATENFAPFVQAYGLQFSPITGDPQAVLATELGQSWLEAGINPLRFINRLIDIARPITWQVMADTVAACQEADLILFQLLAAIPALSISEKMGIPAFPTYLQHVHATAAYPSILTPILPWLKTGLYNRLTYPALEQVLWQSVRSLVNEWRRDGIGLPLFPLVGPFRPLRKTKRPFFYGISPTVLPKPTEWGDHIHLGGYWFLDQELSWQPPPQLVDFLASGPPPIYIGFGSMTSSNPAETTQITLQALAQAKQRGLLLTGWGGLSNADLPDSVFKIESAPHDWLFPQMAAVVHHGGAGTTAAGLRAGVPSIVTPVFGDQPFWGWRVQQMGVGPKPIPHKKLAVNNLAQAMVEATQNQTMQERARHIGQQISAEDGVGRVVEVVNALLSS